MVRVTLMFRGGRERGVWVKGGLNGCVFLSAQGHVLTEGTLTEAVSRNRVQHAGSGIHLSSVVIRILGHAH